MMMMMMQMMMKVKMKMKKLMTTKYLKAKTIKKSVMKKIYHILCLCILIQRLI